MTERRDKAWPLAEADLTNSVCVFDFAVVLFSLIDLFSDTGSHSTSWPVQVAEERSQ